MRFNELTDTAKEKVRTALNDDVFYEHVIADAKEQGRERGFSIEDIQWSGFWSQGDGASWTGSVHLGAFIDKYIKPDDPEITKYTILQELVRDEWVDEWVDINRRSFHYVHSGTMEASGPDSYGERDESVIRRGILAGASVRQLYESIGGFDFIYYTAVPAALEAAKDYADEIYKRLEKEYEWYNSDEHIEELAEINEWQFDEDGSFL
jgi:hypothetical protein